MMVSSYFWWLQIAPSSNKKRVREQAEEIRQLGSFTNFINSPYGSEMINDKTGNIVDWLVGERHQLIVQFVGKLENLSIDWQHISKMLNLRVTELSHSNNSTHSSYQDYYNSSTKKLIEHRFEWTIEQFGYKF